MSPEQASGNAVDPRADLFALGCVMYTVLAGEMPFSGQSALAVMVALANKTPEPVVTKNPAVPQAISDLVALLLEKRPEDRVQTAVEVVNELDRAIVALSSEDAIATVPVCPLKTRSASPDTVGAHKSDTWHGGATGGAGLPRFSAMRRARRVRVRHRPRYRGCCSSCARSASAPVLAPPEPIVVGVLHSQSGTMAVSENPVIDATLLAIEEVNADGGVMGRPLRAVVVDGKSDPEEFAKQAERLLTEERVAVVFGCWTSAARKAVRPVFERNDGLLFYPVQYEGLEESPRIVYLGPAPNQQAHPRDRFRDRRAQKEADRARRLGLHLPAGRARDHPRPRGRTEAGRGRRRDRRRPVHPARLVERTRAR